VGEKRRPKSSAPLVSSDLPVPNPLRCWAEIDLAALQHNAGVARAQVGPGVQLMAVVKANAYGHGLGPILQALDGHAEVFGVANIAEGLEVRAHLPKARVFILGPALPEERAQIVASGFIASISSLEEAIGYRNLAADRPAEVHLIIDTGMGRIGAWQEEAVALARRLADFPQLKVTGLASHLPVADEDESFTREQLARFHQLAAEVRAILPSIATVHVENSAGLLGFPAHAGDLVRAGLMLYGSAPLAEWQAQLKPVLTWKTRITLVREVGAGRGLSYGRTFITPHPMRVATLAVGYADGYQRHLSNRGAEVLIRGRRCAVLGRVTMDQILADVTALPEAQAGEEVVLLGRQDAEEITAAELAMKAGSIAWEIFTGIGPRVVRLYFQ
jgi:alanine racemase